MWSNEYVNIPFAEKGRDKKGADCWGLVMIIYKELLGIDLPSYLEYNDTKDKLSISGMIIDQTIKNWEFIEEGDEQEFDCAVFNISGVPMHVGVVVSPGTMIHCERGRGTWHSEYNIEKQWNNRLEGFYRHADTNSNRPNIITPV